MPDLHESRADRLVGRDDGSEDGSVTVHDHGDAERAKQRARAARKPAAVPPPKPALTLQRTIFWANLDDSAIQYACRLTGWRHALTADPAYAPTVEQVNALKTVGPVDAWGNQEQIHIDTIKDFYARWGCQRIILQAETEAEFISASIADARHVIGNPNAWTDRQRYIAKTLAENFQVAYSGEVYDGRPDTYSSQGVPISSFTLGVALDDGVHYPLGDLLAKTPAGARSSVCIWHGSGLLPEEWELLRAL